MYHNNNKIDRSVAKFVQAMPWILWATMLLLASMGATHNKLHDEFVECRRRANVSAQVEVGSGFGHDKSNTRSADVLVRKWYFGKMTAFDLTITSLLNPSTISKERE